MKEILHIDIRGLVDNKRFPVAKIIGLVVTIVIFAYLIWKSQKAICYLIHSDIHFAPIYLVLSLLSQLVGVLLAAGIWSDILHHVGVNTGYLFDLQVFCASALGRKIPGAIWYALGRFALYRKRRQPNSSVLLALIVEAVVTAVAGLAVFAISLGTGSSDYLSVFNKSNFLFYSILAFVFLIAFIQPTVIRLIAKRVLENKGDKNNLQFYSLNLWHTLRWLIAEILVVTLGANVAFFLIKSISTDISVSMGGVLGAWGLAVALGPLAMWLPLDAGLKNGVMYVALVPFIDSSTAALFTLIWRMWVTLLELSFGLVSSISLSQYMKRDNDND